MFSMMPGDESSQTSGVILRTLMVLVEGVSHNEISTEMLGVIHIIIRKCAHFTEYALLGASVMYAMWSKIKRFSFGLFMVWSVAILYATTDEIHQYFVPGRYGTWTDVLIDSCGAITGILIYRAIVKNSFLKKSMSLGPDYENSKTGL